MKRIALALAIALMASTQALAQVGGPGAFSGAASFGPQSVNSFLAAPSGSAGLPTFRTMTGADLGASTLSPSFAAISSRKFQSTGPVPTLTTGTCSAASAVGGSTAGVFTAPLCAAGTIILSVLPAATNGYVCDATDQTTPANTLKQTAYTTTSVTFTATTTASDIIVWKCRGF